MEHKNNKLKVMTYNVHSCRGMDGRVKWDRIAKVIEECDPDLVALQELDVNRRATRNMDQPLHIADYLRMHCHFQPAIALEGEHYGIAILSRYPFDMVKADHLRRCKSSAGLRSRLPLLKYFYEPREMIWVTLKVGGREVNFLNTHLGLRAKERLLQIQDILSKEWLGSIDKEATTILCGDFNTGSKSKVYQQLRKQFKEVKSNLKQGQLRKTFFSHCPVLELDHIFYTGKVTVDSVTIPSTKSTRMASDHLPLIAGFKF